MKKIVSKPSGRLLLIAFCFMLPIFGYAASTLTIGGMASTITQSFSQVTKLITAGSYLAGLAFSIGSIMKFKQHKDNPTQVPVGTPIAMLFIAAALLFLPTILAITGTTMFGSGGAETASPTGIIFTTGGSGS